VDRYNGVIPIWVLVDVLDFSDVSMLFDGMRLSDQFAVSERLGIRLELDQVTRAQRSKALKSHPFARWLEQLTVVRNIAAHHGRLWNRTVVPAATGAMRSVDGLDGLPEAQSEDIFGALTVIAKILSSVSPGSSWARKVAAEIDQVFGRLDERSVSEMGFPSHWRRMNLWDACSID
jgi:abortive infection bacteriophage resistance protein